MSVFPIFDPTCGRVVEWGLTKRELFAAMAMQGLLSTGANWFESQDGAHFSVKWADALLVELAKPQEVSP